MDISMGDMGGVYPIHVFSLREHDDDNPPIWKGMWKWGKPPQVVAIVQRLYFF